MDEDVRSGAEAVGAAMSQVRQEAGEVRDEIELLRDLADQTGRAIETSLSRAVRSGRIGFEDMGRIAMSVMNQIAQTAVRNGLEAVLRGRGGEGLLNLGTSLVGRLFGLPGRATGGPVSPGQAYLVGERGPEMFLPTSSGQIIPNASSGGARDVRVSIVVNGSGQDAPRALARSARQVARAVRGALAD